MNSNSTMKTWLIIAGIVVASVIAYYIYTSGAFGGGAVIEATPQSETVGNQVLSMLNQIQSLKIDATFFKNQNYSNLVDHSVDIPSQTVGRPNPFAPIPGVIYNINPTAKK